MQINIEQAEALIREGGYEEAESILKNIKKVIPDNGRIYFNLGNIELLKENYSDAKIYYTKAIELGYKTEKCLLNYATVENNLKNTSCAEEYLKKAVKCNNSNIFILDSLIKIYFNTKRFDEAKKIADLMIERCTESYIGYYYKLILHLLYRKYKEARHLIEDIRKKDIFVGNSYVFMRLMLIISLETNDIDTAKMCLKELADEFEYDKAKLSLAVLSIFEKKYLEAAKYLETMVLDNDHSFEYHTAVYLFAVCVKQLQLEDYEDVINAAIHIFNNEYVNDEEHQYILLYEENCRTMFG